MLSFAMVMSFQGSRMNEYQETAKEELKLFYEDMDKDNYSLDGEDELKTIYEDAIAAMEEAVAESEIEKIKDDAMAAMVAVPTAIEDTREAEMAKIDEFLANLDLNLYSADDQKKIDRLVVDVKNEIQVAQNENDIILCYNKLVEEVKQIATVLDSAKEEALKEIDELNRSFNSYNYEDEEVQKQRQIISNARATIEDATSKEDIAAAVNSAQKAQNALPERSVQIIEN